MEKKEIENQGKILRIEMKNGKAPPEKVNQFIQIAVNLAHKSSSKKIRDNKLPNLGNDPTKWEAKIQKWIYEHQFGIDCSGFVFEALRNVHRSLGGNVAEEKYIGQYGRNSSGRIIRPESKKQVDNKVATKVKKPADLQAGDLMQYYKPSSKKVTRHIRIIFSVQKTTQSDGRSSIIFQVAESKGSGSKEGPTIRIFKFPDETEFKNVEQLKNGKWVRDKKQDKYNYFQPKFEF